MAYQSLYRKYRPQTFADVVGQEPVVRTLVNAIREDRLHHAYLFTGPRGTGKTSTARILAKAINCERGPTPEPCDECPMCVSIREGSAVDVVELDMASHGGVDDARELRERALFAPANARRKVYILDEVHMASTAAFNALLKLIEEPPGHVLFAMATTDPQKVLPTIMSRVQRLDLRRVGAADVAAHVERIAGDEGCTLDAAAVDAVVRAGDGSVRDTMSVLEQVLAFGGQTVTGDDVATVLGTTPAELTARAAQHLAQQDAAGALGLVQDLLDGGKDLRRFALDLVGHLRDLLVLQVAPDRPDLVDTTDERRQQLAEQATIFPRETLVRAVDLLAEAITEMRQGPPRLPLELALSRITMPAAAGDVGALADRLARLEQAGVPAPAIAPTPAPAGPAPSASADRDEPGDEAPGAEASGADGPADEPAFDEPAAAAPAPTVAEEPAPATPAATVAEEPAPATPAPTVAEEPAPATPAATVAVEPAPATPAPTGDDALTRVQRSWEAVLDQLRERSKRCHAIFSVAIPVEVEDGVLTLGFGPQHEGFHAKQAPKGDYAETLQEILEQVVGLRPAITATILQEGASSPVADRTEAAPRTEPDEDEEALAVAEAEAEAAAAEEVDDDEALASVSTLLAEELDAEPLD